MQIKTTILFLIAQFYFFYGFCQQRNLPVKEKQEPDFEYSLGESYPYVSSQSKNFFANEGTIISVKFHGTKCVLQKFAGQDQVNRIKYEEYNDFVKGIIEEEILEMDGHIYVFYSKWDDNLICEQLFVREVDAENCSFLDQGRKIIEVKGKVKEGVEAGIAINPLTYNEPVYSMTNSRKKFKLKLSADKSKLLISYKKKLDVKKDLSISSEIGYYIFDTDLGVVKNEEVTMPVAKKRMNVLDYAISENDEIILLSEIYKTRYKAKRFSFFSGNPRFELKIITISNGKVDDTSEKLEIADGIINDCKFFNGPNNEVYLAGYFAEDQWRLNNKATGMFFGLVNNGAVQNFTQVNIPLDVKNQYIKKRHREKNIKKSNRGKPVNLKYMKPKELIFENNSVVLIGQVEYSRTNSSSLPGPTSGVSSGSASVSAGSTNMDRFGSDKSYYSKNILISKMETSGKLVWSTQVPKYQMGPSQFGSLGFKYISGTDGYYFLLIDNKKNVKLKEKQRPYKHYDKLGGHLTAYRISKIDGKMSRDQLFDIRKAKGVSLRKFDIARMFETEPNQFVLECFKKGQEEVMIKFKFNK